MTTSVRLGWVAALLLANVAPAPAQVLVYDRWESAYLEGTRAGHVRTSVVEREVAGKLVHLGTIEMRLQVQRFSERVGLGMDVGTIETLDSRVIGTFMRQHIGKTQKLEIEGVVEDKKLHLTLNKGKALDPAPWTENVAGIYAQQRMFKEKKVFPGDTFSYLAFEPSINLVILTRVTAKEHEEIDVDGKKQKALRVEVRGDKIQNYTPPPLVVWLDESLEPVQSLTEVPGLGKLKLVRTTRNLALATPAAAGPAPKVSQYVAIKQRLTQPHDLKAALYRIVVKDEDDATGAFASDLRQSVAASKGGHLELRVGRTHVAEAEKVADEYLESSHFIASDDPVVKQHAAAAVGTEVDPWRKALRIERYVNGKMSTKAYEALATADHVARNWEGDCTEYAMVTAAMCRAQRIPARTALGLVYGEVRGQPVFAFHMWNEVWAEGQWRSLDATLGLGGVGPAHLKISDQSWRNERSMTPLLPVLRVLGKIEIDILGIAVK